MRHAEDAQDSSMTAFKLLKTEWVCATSATMVPNDLIH
jgi:hypothetical protein